MDGALRHKGEFIGIFMKMRRQGGAGLCHGVLSEHPQTRNSKLLPGIDGAVSGDEIAVGYFSCVFHVSSMTKLFLLLFFVPGLKISILYGV